jgi:O-acetylserine/cysteine efflux transporter
MSLRDIGLALLSVVVLGLNMVAIKVAVSDVPPLFVTGLRFFVVSAIMVWFFPIPKNMWKPIIIFSVAQGLIHHGIMFIGMTGVDAAVGAIIVQLSVPFAVLMAWLMLGENFGWRRTMGIVVSMVGVAILAGEPTVRSAWFFVLLLIVSTFAWAYANIHVKRMGVINILQIITWMAIFATPQLFIASAILETGQFDAIAAAPLKVWGAIFYSALGSTIFAYGIWFKLIAKYDVIQIVPFGLLNPISAVIAGVVLLGETLNEQKIIGGIVVLIGVAIIQLRQRKSAPVSE